jgi:hypothetical protein
VKTIDFYSSGSYQQFIVNTKYLQTLKYLVPPKSGKMSSLSLDQLLKACKDEKVIECLSKLQWKGSKPQRCLLTKTNKDTLCDSLIFIAETLFESASDTGESQQFNDNPTSHTQQPTLLSEGTEEDEDSQSQGQSVVNSDDNNSASHTQQPTLLSQGTEGDSQSQNQSAVNSEDNRPTCKLFLENNVASSFKGAEQSMDARIGSVICCTQGFARTHTSLGLATGSGAKRDTPRTINSLRKGLKITVTSLFYGRSKFRNK